MGIVYETLLITGADPGFIDRGFTFAKEGSIC